MTEPEPVWGRRGGIRGWVAGVALLAGVVWLPTLRHELLFCDDLADLGSAVDRVARGTWLSPRPYYRPVTDLVRAALWRGYGAEPAAHRRVVLGLHAANVGLAALIGRSLGLSGAGAALAAGLFLVAPVQRECVMWTTGLLFLTGGLGALVCAALALRGWLGGWRAAVTGAAFVWSLFGYPYVVAFPVAIALLWRWRFPERPRPTGLLVGTAACVVGWGVLEWVMPVVATGGYYPHLGEVSRSWWLGPLTTLRNLLSGTVYAWLPAGLVEELPRPAGVAVKLAALAVVGGAVSAAWRRGVMGRWLVCWIGLSMFPFAVRHAVDPRMLYVTSAGMCLLLVMAVETLAGPAARAAQAAAVAIALLNAMAHHRSAPAFREAGRETTRILEAVRAQSAGFRPGGMLVLRGFPRRIGTPPWDAPLFVYGPTDVFANALGDPRLEVRFLPDGAPAPRVAGRSLILIDRSRPAPSLP